jgi:hypothetical protein
MTYPKRYTMRAAALDAWLNALRSGEYRQGMGRLCTASLNGATKSFCCLGVLSDLAVKEGACVWSKYPHPQEAEGVDNERHYLPEAVIEWSGLQELSAEQITLKDLVVSTDDSVFEHISDLNDRGRPFTEIADVIEQIVQPV